MPLRWTHYIEGRRAQEQRWPEGTLRCAEFPRDSSVKEGSPYCHGASVHRKPDFPFACSIVSVEKSGVLGRIQYCDCTWVCVCGAVCVLCA